MKAEIDDIIIRLLTGTISEEENVRFNSWLKESPENKVLFEKQRTAWLLAGTLGSDIDKKKNRILKRIVQDKTYTDSAQSRRSELFSFNRKLVAAAIILIAIGIGFIIVYLAGNVRFDKVQFVMNETYTDTLVINSPRGSKTELYLPDGSHIWLNGNSQIKFLSGFENGKREVFLSGEAYFTVEKTSSKDRFHVNTAGVKISVLGTSFNVKAYPAEGVIETTLEEGLVSIKMNGAGGGSKMINLKPNQQAVFIDKHEKISSEKLEYFKKHFNINILKSDDISERFLLNRNVNTELYTVWKNVNLVFEEESFDNIIVKLERWYDVVIKLENENLKHINFTANFKNETIEQALYALKLTHPFQYTFDINKNTIYIK